MHVRVLKGLLAAASLTVASLGASGAAAAAFVFDQTFDLTTANVTSTNVISNNNTGFSPQLTIGSPEIVSNGDSIDYKVTFLPGQGVNFVGGSGTGLFEIAMIGSGLNVQLNTGSTLKLFDTTGGLITTLVDNGFHSSQPNLVGDTFGNFSFAPVNRTLGALEFINPNISGVGTNAHLTSSVVALTSTFGTTLQVVTNAPIPEPGTWAMMLTGLLVTGAAVRSRRARRDATA